MSKGKRAQYTLEFKIEAVRAALARRSGKASRMMDSAMGCAKQEQGHLPILSSSSRGSWSSAAALYDQFPPPQARQMSHQQ